MSHTKLCELSKSKHKYCRCSCKGALHNIKSTEGKGSNEKLLSFNDGGEIESFIREVTAICFNCSCGRPIVVRDIFGYPHEMGLMDKEGKKWWVFIECENCNYNWNWQKILKKKELIRLK